MLKRPDKQSKRDDASSRKELQQKASSDSRDLSTRSTVMIFEEIHVVLDPLTNQARKEPKADKSVATGTI